MAAIKHVWITPLPISAPLVWLILWRALKVKSASNPPKKPKKIIIVGAGVAGLSAAVTAASRGHQVTIYEQHTHIGGQFNMAKKSFPAKKNFFETIRYFREQIKHLNITVHLNTKVDKAILNQSRADHVIIATGVVPRMLPSLEGANLPQVISYSDLLTGKKKSQVSVWQSWVQVALVLMWLNFFNTWQQCI